mmetsp:Transcript_10100/g.30215  ORF Transcript_10100/g.30215 Transcript_10100/m.30215 type:complete len:135 (+) Transcript_10100:700-1104(+)
MALSAPDPADPEQRLRNSTQLCPKDLSAYRWLHLCGLRHTASITLDCCSDHQSPATTARRRLLLLDFLSQTAYWELRAVLPLTTSAFLLQHEPRHSLGAHCLRHFRNRLAARSRRAIDIDIDVDISRPVTIWRG